MDQKDLNTLGQIVEFLKRVQLTGAETPVFNECIGWIQNVAKQINAELQAGEGKEPGPPAGKGKK